MAKYMPAAEVTDRVRQMRTGEHLVIAGKDKPTEDFDPGILHCIGIGQFRARYKSGGFEDLILHPSPSKCITNDIEMGLIVGVLEGSEVVSGSNDEGDNMSVKQLHNEMKGAPGVAEGKKDNGDGEDDDDDDESRQQTGHSRVGRLLVRMDCERGLLD